MSMLTDTQIIRQVLDGKINAFELLLERYRQHVLRIVKKHIPFDQIEEVAHDVFVRAYQALPSCQQPDRFPQWLSAVAVRTCYDFWRAKYRKREVPMSSLSEQQQRWVDAVISTQSQAAYASHGDDQDRYEVLHVALNRLSPEDRMVVELVHLEGYSHKEAANLLGWSTANVKIRAFRARKQLHKFLTREKNA